MRLKNRSRLIIELIESPFNARTIACRETRVGALGATENCIIRMFVTFDESAILYLRFDDKEHFNLAELPNESMKFRAMTFLR